MLLLYHQNNDVDNFNLIVHRLSYDRIGKYHCRIFDSSIIQLNLVYKVNNYHLSCCLSIHLKVNGLHRRLLNQSLRKLNDIILRDC